MEKHKTAVTQINTLLSLGSEQAPDKILDILVLINTNLNNTLITNDIKVLNQETVYQHTGRDKTNADNKLENAREVITSRVHRSKYTIHAV